MDLLSCISWIVFINIYIRKFLVKVITNEFNLNLIFFMWFNFSRNEQNQVNTLYLFYFFVIICCLLLTYKYCNEEAQFDN